MKSFSALSAAGRRLFVRQDDRRLCAPWAAARPRDRYTRASLGASARCPARPCRHPRAPQPGPGLLSVAQSWLSIINFACNSPEGISGFEI